MIIASSAVRMDSERSFASTRRYGSLSGRTGMGILRSGRFVKTVISAEQNTIDKDAENGQENRGTTGSKNDLMARFSQSRSVRASSLENDRGIRALHTIRKQSIGYLLHQLFWKRSMPSLSDPLSALFDDYSKLNQTLMPLDVQPLQLSSNYAYAEYEQTTFATEGTVVTASGKEINFNVGFSMSRSFYEEVSATVDLSSLQMTDPLVINLDCDVASVSDQKFYFDLDADGHEEEISQLGAGSGFLALDKNGDGKINDGSELFGTASGNGFADLAKYDQDGNGWIDEADEIFDKLLIWQKDENGNDVLRGLGQAGVGAIYLGNIHSDFSLNSADDNQTNAKIRQSGMFLYENGNAGTIQQVDFAK